MDVKTCLEASSWCSRAKSDSHKRSHRFIDLSWLLIYSMTSMSSLGHLRSDSRHGSGLSLLYPPPPLLAAPRLSPPLAPPTFGGHQLAACISKRLYLLTWTPHNTSSASLQTAQLCIADEIAQKASWQKLQLPEHLNVFWSLFNDHLYSSPLLCRRERSVAPQRKQAAKTHLFLLSSFFYFSIDMTRVKELTTVGLKI